MNSKISAGGTASAPSPYLVLPEVLQKDQDGPTTTLCTLMHKVSHLKLSNTSSLLGIKSLSSAVKELAVSKLQGSSAADASDNTCNLASAAPSSQQDKCKMSTGKKSWPEEMHLGGEDWHQGSNAANKVSQGWLHSNEKILGPGVTYIVKVGLLSSHFLFFNRWENLCLFQQQAREAERTSVCTFYFWESWEEC